MLGWKFNTIHFVSKENVTMFRQRLFNWNRCIVGWIKRKKMNVFDVKSLRIFKRTNSINFCKDIAKTSTT